MKPTNGNTALPPLRPTLKSADDMEFLTLMQKALHLAGALETLEARLLVLERKRRRGLD